MDIQKIISDIVSKITGNADLIKNFTSDPGKIIKELTGFDVNPDQLQQIISGVTKALGNSAGDLAKDGKGLLDKIKGFFGK